MLFYYKTMKQSHKKNMHDLRSNPQIVFLTQSQKNFKQLLIN